MNILIAGATGTIGRTVATTLVAAGHNVICALRPSSALPVTGVSKVRCDLNRRGDLLGGLGGQRIDAVISCMASRSGAPSDSWAVEHDSQIVLLDDARSAGARHFILLSAICVQKPKLAFQHAKLAFEQHLQKSGVDWTIVRPTAFFKSLSGQVARVQSGKPFLVFGDGRLTACKPISDRDLAAFLVDCLTDEMKQNRVLPIGGPGPAITPLDQAERLFELLGQKPRIRRVPVAMMTAISRTLGLLGRVNAKLADKAEFARTGHYYATESMLVWDEEGARYDADATPEFGSDTLWDHYADLIAGRVQTDLGAHAIF
ncbi:MAG: NAD(P)H-binding protein [Pseudomonadota bacterium]